MASTLRRIATRSVSRAQRAILQWPPPGHRATRRGKVKEGLRQIRQPHVDLLFAGFHGAQKTPPAEAIRILIAIHDRQRNDLRMHHQERIAVCLLAVHVQIAIFRGWRNLLQFLPGRIHLALLRLASLPHLGPGWTPLLGAVSRQPSAKSATQGNRNATALARRWPSIAKPEVGGCGCATKSSIARETPDRAAECAQSGWSRMVHFPRSDFGARFSRKACAPSACRWWSKPGRKGRPPAPIRWRVANRIRSLPLESSPESRAAPFRQWSARAAQPGQQLIRSDHFIHQAQPQGLVGGDILPGQNHLERSPFPDQPRATLGSPVAGDSPHLHLGLARPGIGAGDTQGAGEGQFATAAQGKAVDACDHWLAAVFDEVEDALAAGGEAGSPSSAERGRAHWCQRLRRMLSPPPPVIKTARISGFCRMSGKTRSEFTSCRGGRAR